MGRVQDLVLVVVVSILTTEITAYLPQEPVLEYGDISSTPAPVYCDRQYSCLDCTTARVCAPTDDGTRLYEIGRVTCPSSASICDFGTGTCTDSSSASCPLPPAEANNICMRNGIFPDPSNCSRYFHCQGDQATTFACPTSAPYYAYIYDSCTPYSQYCINGKYRCKLYRNGMKVSVGWSFYKSYNYYLYCKNSSAILIDRCIGANYFDDQYQRCLPYCPFIGLYPSQDDCSEYYKCTSDSQCYACEGFTLTNMTCPPGQGFSETEFQCMDRSLVPNCNVPNPDFFNKR